MKRSGAPAVGFLSSSSLRDEVPGGLRGRGLRGRRTSAYDAAAKRSPHGPLARGEVRAARLGLV